jgi:hypothetical protein
MMKKDDLIILLIGMLLLAAMIITVILGGEKSLHGVGLSIDAKPRHHIFASRIKLDLGQRPVLPVKV